MYVGESFGCLSDVQCSPIPRVGAAYTDPLTFGGVEEAD